MSDPKWLAKAEELAGPHHTGANPVCPDLMNCPWTKRVQAAALALEEAHAEGLKEAARVLEAEIDAHSRDGCPAKVDQGFCECYGVSNIAKLMRAIRALLPKDPA